MGREFIASAPDSWSGLQTWLQDCARSLPSSSLSLSDIAPTPDLSESIRLFERAESKVWREIQDAVDRWLDTGTWPVLSPVAAYFVRCRLGAAADFCWRLAGPKDTHPAPIVFPARRKRGLLRWLLTQYWAFGRQDAAQHWAASCHCLYGTKSSKGPI